MRTKGSEFAENRSGYYRLLDEQFKEPAFKAMSEIILVHAPKGRRAPEVNVGADTPQVKEAIRPGVKDTTGRTLPRRNRAKGWHTGSASRTDRKLMKGRDFFDYHAKREGYPSSFGSIPVGFFLTRLVGSALLVGRLAGAKWKDWTRRTVARMSVIDTARNISLVAKRGVTVELVELLVKLRQEAEALQAENAKLKARVAELEGRAAEVRNDLNFDGTVYWR